MWYFPFALKTSGLACASSVSTRVSIRSLLILVQQMPSCEVAIRILYTGSIRPPIAFQRFPAMYHRYHISSKRRILGPLRTNGSSSDAPKTGPRPSLVNDLPPSRLDAQPIATLKGTDSQRVQPA